MGNCFHLGKKWRVESLEMDFSFKPEEYEELLKERHSEYRDSFIYYPQACGEIKHFNCVWKFVCKLLTQKDSPGNNLLQTSWWTPVWADMYQNCPDILCCWKENAVSCWYPQKNKIWYKAVAIFSTGIYEKHNLMIWPEVKSTGHASDWGCRTRFFGDQHALLSRTIMSNCGFM